MEINKNVLNILNTLEKNGFEGYVVGGCVRDSLMGITPHDYDITTNALPSDIKRIFRHTVDTGIKHGTVTVVSRGENYEVTTYRIDGEYKDGRHPENVVFTDKITEDLSRRDFTMNAIAYNPQRGYVDPFDGKGDIKKRIIRGVREPYLRFREDALRMFRCLRFSAQLGFDIEEKTYEAIIANRELIKNVSAERVAAEFLKLITSEYSHRVLLIQDSGLGDHCIPQAAKALKDRGEEISRLLKSIKTEDGALAVIYAKSKDPTEAFKDLRLSNELIKNTLMLIKYYDFEITGDKYDLRRLLSEMGKGRLFKLLCIKRAKNEKNIDAALKFVQGEEPMTRKELDINGRDLSELGFKGEEIGRAIDRLLDIVLREPEKNKREILLKEAIKWQR